MPLLPTLHFWRYGNTNTYILKEIASRPVPVRLYNQLKEERLISVLELGDNRSKVLWSVRAISRLEIYGFDWEILKEPYQPSRGYNPCHTPFPRQNSGRDE